MKDNGIKVKNVEEANYYEKMDPYMKVNGKMICQMVKEDSSIKTEIYMKEIG